MSKQASELERSIEEIVEAGSNLAASLGLNRVAGELYCLLFMSPGPLCLDDMMKSLKISKGQESTNIRTLERWQAVRKIWVKGTRKDYYEANCNTLKIVTAQLRLGLVERIGDFDKITSRAKEKLKAGPECESKDAKIIQDRIQAVVSMQKKILSILSKLDIFL